MLGSGRVAAAVAGGQEAVGVSTEVFMVLSQNKVQQRFVEQGLETRRIVLESSPTWAWWRAVSWKPGHYFYELLFWHATVGGGNLYFATSPLYLAVIRPGRVSLRLLDEFTCDKVFIWRWLWVGFRRH